MFLTTLNTPPSSCHQALGRNKLLFLPSSIISKNLFPPTAESGGGNNDLLQQNSVRKYEDDKCDGFTFL